MQSSKIPELKLKVPDPVSKILEVLQASGYEAYIVGGCVRDALLGRVPEDWDITTSALPQEVKKLFRNTVDTGIQHGTVMVILEGAGYEVTTYRIDGPYMDSRHPSSVTFTRSLDEDLKRRDFTINAFAWDENGLIDRFDGLSDLENRVIRCVRVPAERFEEDALRIMRAVRFSAQLGFEIEPETARMARCYADKLADISMERIRVEWEKTLLSDHPCRVNRYAQLNMAPYIIKEQTEKCFDPANDPLLMELFGRRKEALRQGKDTERGRRLLMAAFFGSLTPEEADRAFRGLKYDNQTRQAVVQILRFQDAELADDRILIKQQLNRMGEETFFSVLELKEARLSSGTERATAVSGKVSAELLDRIRKTAEDILETKEPFLISHLAVSGNDLIAAGVAPGKKIGDFLENILQKVIQSPTLNRKEVLCNSKFLSEVEYECKNNL